MFCNCKPNFTKKLSLGKQVVADIIIILPEAPVEQIHLITKETNKCHCDALAASEGIPTPTSSCARWNPEATDKPDNDDDGQTVCSYVGMHYGCNGYISPYTTRNSSATMPSKFVALVAVALVGGLTKGATSTYLPSYTLAPM